MADDTSTEPQQQENTPDAEPEPAKGDDLGDAGKRALDAERQRAKDAEKRAKQLERELEQHRQASMSESEKAVAEAEKRGRESAASEFGQRLARSDYVAAAARRNPGFDVGPVLEELNLARFVTEQGDPDGDAISRSVERLVPAADQGAPSFDGGARTTPPAPVGMNGLIRKAAGRA